MVFKSVLAFTSIALVVFLALLVLDTSGYAQQTTGQY
jgi:Fe2+ transport system protein B